MEEAVTTQGPNLCRSCRHLDRSERSIGYEGTARCVAFPEAIPVDIWTGADHREPDPRQTNDITYDLADPDWEPLLTIWWEHARARGVA